MLQVWLLELHAAWVLQSKTNFIKNFVGYKMKVAKRIKAINKNFDKNKEYSVDEAIKIAQRSNSE